MTKKEMQELQKTIDKMQSELSILKALRKNMLREINNMGKAYDKIKNML
jgi:hypothetical protein